MIITLTFIIYLVLMLAIGVVAYRRTKDLSDYVLGGGISEHFPVR